MRRLVATWALALAACGPPPEYGAAVFAVGDVPEEVSTISVFVRESGRAEVVASATVTVPSTKISLGVPAEVPLDITAVARSDRPAPEVLGGTMPVYVGRTQRTVPLGTDPAVVGLDVQPGGGLTMRIEGVDEGGRQTLALLDEGAGRPLLVGVPTRGGRIAQALVEGRWRLVSRDDRWSVIGGEGLWIAKGVESRAVVQLRPTPAERPPEAPHALVVTLFDDEGPVRGWVRTSTRASSLSVQIEAVDATGAPVDAPPAEVSLRMRAAPEGVLGPGTTAAVGLPAVLGGWAASGSGRLHVFVRAQVGEATLTASAHLSVGGPGGAPRRLALELADPERVATGTRLLSALVDDQDRLAEAPGWTVDASGSDPWIYFPQGPTRAVSEPVALLEIARPSAPAGRRLEVRAVATSTAFTGTSTAALALPLSAPDGLGPGGGG